jgi:predicted permease
LSPESKVEDRSKPLVAKQTLHFSPGGGGVQRMRDEYQDGLHLLMWISAFVLLIACANLANLLLARGAARRPEIALRLSLGASRARLVRQLVTESLALAIAGGLAAVAVASLIHSALVALLAKSDSDFQIGFTLDPIVLTFVVAATVGATVLFGVLPAWQATKTDARAALNEQHRGAGASLGPLRSGRLLVGVQLALSLPLLVGAGLLARTVYNLQRADLGFPAERLLLTRVDLREAGYEGARRERVLRDLVAAIRRIPGVQSTSFSQLGVFTGGESAASVAVEGYVPKGERDHESALDVIGPGYFSTLGVPMRLGREIQDTDRSSAPPICVINQAFATHYFEARNSIGMRITPINDDGGASYEIVGVASDARTHSLRGEVAPRYFVMAREPASSSNSPTLLIRTAAATASLVAAVGTAIHGVDAAIPILSANSIEEQLAPLTAQDRATAQLAVVFGSVALTLAAIGLYGVLSYGVARRTGEIAIRIALGAPSGRVIAMILRETSAVVLVGVVFGGGLAYAASRLVDSRLYGV